MEKKKHPGIYLNEIVCKKHNLSYQEVAKKLGYTEYYLRDRLRGYKPLSEKLAERFAEVYSISNNELMKMQREYDKEYGRVSHRGPKVDPYQKNKAIPADLIKEIKDLNRYLKDQLEYEYPGRQRTYEFIEKEKSLTKKIDKALQHIEH